MTLNPQYEAIGKGFVQQYYAFFDDPTQRLNLINMYNIETSFMSFEGTQLQGSVKIAEKLNALPLQKITRAITTVDSQPTFDGGVMISVIGRLQADGDPPHAFTQVFVLKPSGDSFYIQHDVFRLVIHDTAQLSPHEHTFYPHQRTK